MGPFLCLAILISATFSQNRPFKLHDGTVIVGSVEEETETYIKIKTKFGGSSAGHNGIESIDKFIGKDYSRVRIGIGIPNGKDDAANHVLKDFDEEEKVELENMTKNITNSLPILLDKKLDLFSSAVNNK